MGIALWASRIILVVGMLYYVFLLLKSKKEVLSQDYAIVAVSLAVLFQIMAIIIHPLVGVTGTICIGVATLVFFVIDKDKNEYANWKQLIAVWSLIFIIIACLIIEIIEAFLGRLF